MQNFITQAEIARAANATPKRVERRLSTVAPDGLLHGGKFNAKLYRADRLMELVQVVNRPAAQVDTTPAAIC